MFNRALTSIFGSRNERVLRDLSKTVKRINALEPEFEKLSDDALRGKTEEFRQRLGAGETLDKLLPEAFAVTREAAKRVLGMRHYDVQLIGGMVLHGGRIAEMRTGEGKTLVGTLPVYLNALESKGVHVVTVNDYLARRDSAQMGKLYNFLGLTVGVVYPGMDHADKRSAYQADITYGTNNEFGFDYLRDNMALSREQRNQRGLHYAIVDEVDSILIDEARTPLIISGPAEDSPQLYIAVNKVVPGLSRQEKEDGPGDYFVDEKQKQVHMSEEGMEHAEQLLREAGVIDPDSGLYDSKNLAVVHHMNAALRANAIYQRDVDYIVRDGEVIIVDEFTGRTLAGRRWSDGLHQAVEAKEGVPIQRENQTLATVTFQNLFRMYKKLAGMTGTADTEAYEFQTVYGLEVVVIPTHKPMVRVDNPDSVFLGSGRQVQGGHRRHQGLLRARPAGAGRYGVHRRFGTGFRLVEEGTHSARSAQREAARARSAYRRPGRCAGLGHDRHQHGWPRYRHRARRQPGSGPRRPSGRRLDADRQKVRDDWKKRHEQVLGAGGLHIIGTERHESRRIDNQLRGRSGRQGDPGSSRFYLSLQDNLMRIFGGERIGRWMQMFGMKEDEALEDRLITRQIEKVQRKVEQHNFDIRKNLLEFDDVANDQRKVIYAQRDELLETDDISDMIGDIRQDVVVALVRKYVPADSIDDQWDIAGLDRELASELNLRLDLAQWVEAQQDVDADGILDHVREAVDNLFAEKETQVGAETMRSLEKHVMLSVVDNAWKEHLASMDYLRQGIYLRGYAQKQPKQEFKRESFELFSEMLDRIKGEVVQMLARIRIRSEEEVLAMEAEQQRAAESQRLQFQHADAQAMGQGGESAVAEPALAPVMNDGPKVGRNDPCPCGSGKKYKHCHGQLS